MFTQLKTTWLSTDPLIRRMQPQFKHNMYFKGVAVGSDKKVEAIESFLVGFKTFLLATICLEAATEFQGEYSEKKYYVAFIVLVPALHLSTFVSHTFALLHIMPSHF